MARPFRSAARVAKSFGTQEYEFYVQDSFKWKRNLTVTYGVRYSIDTVPYERNGVEGVSQTPLSQFFADRVGGQALGIPNAALPTATLTYNLGGPGQQGPGWFPRDNNNFAPRLSMAYAPDGDGMLTRLLGKGSVIRAGAGLIYDHYGTSMVHLLRVLRFARALDHGLAAAEHRLHHLLPLQRRRAARHPGRAGDAASPSRLPR